MEETHNRNEGIKITNPISITGIQVNEEVKIPETPPKVPDSSFGLDLLANPKKVIHNETPTEKPDNVEELLDEQSKNITEEHFNDVEQRMGDFRKTIREGMDGQGIQEEFMEEPEEIPEEEPHMTYEAEQQRKRQLLYNFTKYARKGKNYKPSKQYSINSDLGEMEAENISIEHKYNTDKAIQFARKGLMFCVSGIELLNNKFDPFEVNLNGWSESVMEDINSYDDIFEELYEKYKDKAHVAPEFKLLFALAGSAFWFHITKTMGNIDIGSVRPPIFMPPPMDSAGGQVPDRHPKRTSRSPSQRPENSNNLMNGVNPQLKEIVEKMNRNQDLPPDLPKPDFDLPPEIGEEIECYTEGVQEEIAEEQVPEQPKQVIIKAKGSKRGRKKILDLRDS